MAAGAAVLARVLIEVDEASPARLPTDAAFIFGGTAEGARSVLSTIASSMITVAGVTFSITIVSLALAAQQFGPRLLRNFIGDRGNQVVLGTFLATFLYCVLTLRHVRSGDAAFVPNISVTAGLVLAVFSLGVLIYFIHHISTSIQASNVVARVWRQANKTIERLYPKEIGSPQITDENKTAELSGHYESRKAAKLRSPSTGYLQAVKGEKLMQIAIENDWVVELDVAPGAFLVKNCEMGTIWSQSETDDEAVEELTEGLIIGKYPTDTQDLKYIINQFVEIACRALSPGVNDPFTAMTCIDYLGATLSKLCGREMPSKLRYDHANQLRLVTNAAEFDDFIFTATEQIRLYSVRAPHVAARLLGMLAVVAGFTCASSQREALLRHANHIVEGSRNLLSDADSQLLRARYEQLTAVIEERESAQTT